ncbi:MAG TPA: hypothetical protein VNO21_17810, partial [Polyangiaceae bacterium]|nr:hypothetical protein [Polyangiaceae bacterium]
MLIKGRRLLCGIAVSATVTALSLPTLTGCPASACPLPKTSALTITPAPPSCLQSKLSSCAHATIELDNACSDALYVPVDDGIFVQDVIAG